MRSDPSFTKSMIHSFPLYQNAAVAQWIRYCATNRKVAGSVVATSALRGVQYEEKTHPKLKRLDGLLKKVTVEGVLEAKKAVFLILAHPVYKM